MKEEEGGGGGEDEGKRRVLEKEKEKGKVKVKVVDVGSCREPFQERVAYWAERFHGVYRVDRQMETEDTGSDLSKSLLLTLHTQLDYSVQ